MPETILLQGCTPEPLASYLKALGILRLIVEQKQDRKAKGYWQNDTFVLTTSLSQDDLEKFFLYQYEPTPLVAPWNGSTGFYPKDNKKTLEAIKSAEAPRLQTYRTTVDIAQKQVNDLGLTVQPKEKEEKRRLLERLRNNLPDEAVKWLDTCALVTSEDLKFPPLTGTGGNDGNFEFSRTFIQQLQNLMDFQTGEPLPAAIPLLRAALFDQILPSLPFSGKIGQFNPTAAGGANAAPGYDGDSRVNPWDYVLMLEGIMLFTAGATRRYEQAETGDFAYPFTVRPANVGYGSASEGDEARAELWIPLWTSPVGLKELQVLFGEGRAKVGSRQAKDGVDFARAISSLGVDRGIKEFVRYSFQVRNGLSYFAIPLGRFQPKQNPQVDRLAEIDQWLLNFKRTAQDTNAPASVKQAHRRLDTTILNLSQGKSDLLDLLIALGEVEAALDRSLRFTQGKFLRPLPLLSSDWLKDCDDQSPEFRLGLALAGCGLRQRLVRVRQKPGSRFPEWVENDDGVTTWQQGSLVKNLIALLKREEIESQKRDKQQEREAEADTKPDVENQKRSPPKPPVAQLDDVMAWIDGIVDDQRVEAIARGLCLVKSGYTAQTADKPPPISITYALVKLVHQRLIPGAALQSFEETLLTNNVVLPRVPALLGKLSAGDCRAATNLAIRRLRASGLESAIAEGVYEPSDRTLRIAAALAFPISPGATARLLRQIRKIEPKE